MSRAISAELRLRVAKRANFCCEYCRLQEEFAIYPYQIDHIIAIRHGGETVFANLAYACVRCNRNKGTDLTTFLFDKNLIVRIFNPRLDRWDDHFEIDTGLILPKTMEGEATIKLLDLNLTERIIGRQILMEAGLYP